MLIYSVKLRQTWQRRSDPLCSEISGRVTAMLIVSFYGSPHYIRADVGWHLNTQRYFLPT